VNAGGVHDMPKVGHVSYIRLLQIPILLLGVSIYISTNSIMMTPQE
jgi:hypothetical protein